MKNEDKKYHLISLGCAKNTVDSDSMAMLLNRDGYEPVDDPDQADIVIVNTCGFIAEAREEAYAVLDEIGKQKHPGQMLIAAGCLTQRFGHEVIRRNPAIDGILGTRRWMDILDVVNSIGKQRKPVIHLPGGETVGRDERDIPRVSVQGASAYLKIADGCRRGCAFCSIPLIKGTCVSRPVNAILQEAELLQRNDIREIILIAQDTTDYGSDFGLKDGLPELLEMMLPRIPNIDWVRIMYAYPGFVSDRMIDLMADSPQILPYLDIPLQHADPEILKKMNRPSNMIWVYKTLDKIRKKIPELALRTTFIVGYPGEEESHFQRLMDFVEETRFDRVGVFPFSLEPGTSSEPYGDPVSQEEKEERIDRLMRLQQQISLEKNQTLIGEQMDVLIEGKGEVEGSDESITIGRTYRDAPEIDGYILIEGDVPVGEIVPVHITGAMVYDLTGLPLAATKPKR